MVLNLNNKLISIILPVYNCEKFIKESISSILLQTHKNFELLIINDGSTDSTEAIASSFKDKRIIIHNTDHSGLINALNFGINKAKGDFIARMDADDISHPNRLRLQLENIINNNSDICGCSFFTIDEKSYLKRAYKIPFNLDDIKIKIIFNVPFCHGSILAKKNIFLKFKYGSDQNNIVEDYNLWIRMIENDIIFTNCNQKLYFLRQHSKSLSKSKGLNFNNSSMKVGMGYLLNNLQNLTFIINKKTIKELICKEISNIDKDYALLMKILFKYSILKNNFKNNLKYIILNFRTYIYYLTSLIEVINNFLFIKSYKRKIKL